MAKACGFFMVIILSIGLCLPANAQRADTVRPSRVTMNRDTLKMPLALTHADSLAIHRRDSIRRANLVEALVSAAKLMSLDSLKALIKHTAIDTFKAPLYTELASRYLNYDTIVNAEQRQAFQKEGLNYSITALHLYSKYNDSTGLRASFDGMAKVYLAQKKYSQAKWFILQSNTISRAQNDVPNIIKSLLVLVDIQSGIKEYKLARSDLDEALQLSIKNHFAKTQLDIFKKYALVYSRMKDYTKEAIMLKKYDSLTNKIRRDEAALTAAKIAADNLTKKKKQEALQSKKKALSAALQKLKGNNCIILILGLMIILVIIIIVIFKPKKKH